jgi:catechol 2,3-dioxygenase-like lactoylglutathione lyase family enzyme
MKEERTTRMEEYYPMPAFAQLQVADLDQATRWYTDVLGFRSIFTMPGPGGAPLLAHLRRSRYQDLLLVRARKPRAPGVPVGVGVALYFQFEESFEALDALAERARQAGGTVEGPANTPWNTREAQFLDPDGYRLVFTKGPLEAHATMDDIVARAQSPQNS